MRPDLFEATDYYNLDDQLSEEHILVRNAARAWVKRAISPIILLYKSNHLLFGADSILPFRIALQP
ncbi:MAG TPA: hypothetical protein VKZ93_03060 [Arenibacter sp.]|nr:hypothetical protein [Arenibacter sp.]